MLSNIRHVNRVSMGDVSLANFDDMLCLILITFDELLNFTLFWIDQSAFFQIHKSNHLIVGCLLEMEPFCCEGKLDGVRHFRLDYSAF